MCHLLQKVEDGKKGYHGEKFKGVEEYGVAIIYGIWAQSKRWLR